MHAHKRNKNSQPTTMLTLLFLISLVIFVDASSSSLDRLNKVTTGSRLQVQVRHFLPNRSHHAV